MRGIVFRIVIAAGGENGGHCLPEAIDALFDISYHEQVAFLPGKRPEQRVLRGIGVLVFIHHDLGKTAGKLLSQRGGTAAFAVQQQAQAFVLQIIIVQQFFLPLAAGKFLGIAGHKPAQRVHDRRHGGQIRPALRLAAAEKLFGPFQLFLYAVPQCLDLLFVLDHGGVLAAYRRQPGQRGGTYGLLQGIIAGVSSGKSR